MRAVVNVALSPLKRGKGAKLGATEEQALQNSKSPSTNHPFRRNSQHRREEPVEASGSVFSVEESTSSQQTPAPAAPPPHAVVGQRSQHPSALQPTSAGAVPCNGGSHTNSSPSRHTFRRSGSLQSGDGSRDGDSPESPPPVHRATWRRPFQKSEQPHNSGGNGSVAPKSSASYHPERSFEAPECHPDNARSRPNRAAHAQSHPRALRRMSAGPTFQGYSESPSQQQQQQHSGGAGGESSHRRRMPRRLSAGSGTEGEWIAEPRRRLYPAEAVDPSQAPSSPRGLDPCGDYSTSGSPVHQPRRLSAGPGAPSQRSPTTLLQQKRLSTGSGEVQPHRQHPQQRQPRRMSAGSADPTYFDRRTVSVQHPQQRQPRRMSAGSADPTYFDRRPASAQHPQPSAPPPPPPPPLRQARRMSTGTADPSGWNSGNWQHQQHQQQPLQQQHRPSCNSNEEGPSPTVTFRPQQRRMSTGTSDPQTTFYPEAVSRIRLNSNGSDDPPPTSETAMPSRQPRRMSAGSADPGYFVDHGNRRRPSSGSGESNNHYPPPSRQQQQRRMSAGTSDPSAFEPMSHRSSVGSGDSYPTPNRPASRSPTKPKSPGKSDPVTPQRDLASRRSSTGSGTSRASPMGTSERTNNGGPEHPTLRAPSGTTAGNGSPNRVMQARRASNGSGECFDSRTPSSHRRVVSPTSTGSPPVRYGQGSVGDGCSPQYRQVNNPSQRSASTNGSSGSSRSPSHRPPPQGPQGRRPSAETSPLYPPPASPSTAPATQHTRSSQQRSPASSSGRQSVSSRRGTGTGGNPDQPSAAPSLPPIPGSPVKPSDRGDADWQLHRTPVRSPQTAASTWTSFDIVESSPSSANDVRPSAPVRTRTMESSRSSLVTEHQHMYERYPLEREAMAVEEYYVDGDDAYVYDDDGFEGEHSYTDAYEHNHGENDDIIVVMDDDEEEEGEDYRPDQYNLHGGDPRALHPPFEGPSSPAPPPTKIYDFARRCQWDLVLRECQERARDASFVCPKDGTTALHLAVMSRCNPLLRNGELQGYKPASRLVVEALLVACPEAAITRCAVKKYTPLTYACLVTDEGFDMSDAADMVVTILRHAPQSAYVFTDDGFSALDVHIMSYSRLHGHKEEVYSGGRTSTVVVRTLLEEKPALAEARSYRNKIRGPLELLYRCNMDEFKEAVESGSTRSCAPQKLASVVSQLSDWWAWKWAQLLMKAVSTSDEDAAAQRPFQAVQAAARIVGCPIPILQLAIGMHSDQVEERDPRGELYNLPLHEVASWRCDAELVCGDAFVIRRKVRALELLLEEYPVAARTTNNMGETPLQLAVEAGTPWHGGLELLVRACPKALKFPRRLRHRGTDANKTALSVTLHSDLLSVDSGDEDPAAALEGMYPFMVAAVLSRVPERQRRDPSFFFEGETREEHRENLAKKDLESVRSVYGLLRARPDCLARYAADVRSSANTGRPDSGSSKRS